MQSKPHIAVVGAGIVGICSAYFLQKNGFQVTLLDKKEPGSMTSFGHACTFADYASVPVNSPGLFRDIPSMLLSSDGPLAVDFFHVLKNLNWTIKFLQNCTTKKVEYISNSLSNLLNNASISYDEIFTDINVSKYIKNENLRKVFSIHPLLVGGNPYSTTSIYSLIHFLERKWGVFFAKGGTGALVRAIEKLMIEEGIKIEKGFDVSSISINSETSTVRSVQSLDGRSYSCDGLVFNGDPPFAYQNLLPKNLNRQLIRRPDSITKYSMGLFVLFFGTKCRYESVSHHTIWLGSRHKDLLRDIFDNR